MSRPVVSVTRRLPREVEEALTARFDARLNADDHPMTQEELHAALRDADALLCTVTDRIGAAVIGAPPVRCRLLANFGVGFNHVDLPAARAAGIAVTNTPGVLTEATADLTIALMLAVARRIGEGERLVRAGRWTGWNPTQLMGQMVSGRTLGIIGFGRIGQAVARRASHGFGMRVLFTTPHPPPAEVAASLGAEARSLDALLAESDFVSLHSPATPATRHLMNASRLRRMRPGAYLINTARGDIVDEVALVNALREQTIAGAALDVYEGEPAVPMELRAMENVVLLPHLGSATEETRVAMGLRALANLAALFGGGELPDRVG
jgi:lactate dehydrogenase-like 2-hydroxyacid dehydrogenase